MKRALVIGAFVAAATMAAGTSWAVSPGSAIASTATVTVGGTPEVSFSLKLRNTSAPLGADVAGPISFPAVTPASGWKIANQLLFVQASVTDLGGGLQVYTDNRAADASPRYIGANGTDPAGLVASNGQSRIQTAWSIKGSSAVVVNTAGTLQAANEIRPANPQLESGDPNFWQWFYFTDKKTGDPTSTFVNGAPYITAINAGGYHFATGGNDEFLEHQDGQDTFIYLQANFGQAAAQTSYGSNKIIVQAFAS